MTVTPGDWLVAVDPQRVFADPASEWRAPRFADVVAPIRALATAHGDRVVCTRFVAPAEPAGAWVDYYRRFPWALLPPDDPVWDVVDELADVAAAGRVLSATTFGKWGPELAAIVGPGARLTLAGVSTDCCVLSTALAAADAGVAVRVVPEACAGADDASHERALATMALYAPLIRVVPLAELLAG